MSRDTDNTFFILSPLTAKYAALYQELFSGIVSFEQLGNRIIREIKAAHAFREIGQVRELSRILINIPMKEFQLIAQYYLAWSECRNSTFHAQAMEQIIEQSKTYKVKALLSRGAFEGYQNDLGAALYFYTEALKAKPTLSESLIAVRSISFIKSLEGFHKSALTDLEKLIPIVRYAEPLDYYDYLNSYAVELGNAGRKDEARNISRIVMASPFIHAYPEWQDTARELKKPDRSFVAIDRAANQPCNVVHMPLVEHVESERVSYNPPARVTNLQQWKTKMGKEEKPQEEIGPKQVILRIIDFYTNKNTTDEQRYELWEAFQKVINPRKPKPDDSEGA